MEILLFDKESSQNDIYDIVANHLNITFKKVTTVDSFYKLYTANLDSLIIIDVTEEDGEEIFHHITKTRPKQKILVLSKKLTYNHTFTCEQCDQMFNRKLLLKPLNVSQLIHYIINFDTLLCRFSSNSNNIKDIMSEILEQFFHYHYNAELKTIEKISSNTSDVRELISITELLSIHNIRYTVEEKEQIKLHF